MSSTGNTRVGADLDADPDQGTAVYLLDAQEEFEAADLLEVATLRYGWYEDSYGEDHCQAVLEVDVRLLPHYTDAVLEAVGSALRKVHAAGSIWISDVVAEPRRVTGDWRELRRQERLTGINNQATRMPLPQGHPKKYGLNFRDPSEVRVFEAFERAQRRLAEEATLLIAPNAVVFVAGKTREVDLLVTYRGRAGVVEVDGDAHRRGNRYAADQSRDGFLRDAGVLLVERVAAEDTEDPAGIDRFVQRFLDRLVR